MIKLSKLGWVILFGGAGRENIVNTMHEAGLFISKIIVPQKQSKKLEASIDRISGVCERIIRVNKKQISDALKGEESSALLSIGYPYLIPQDLYDKHVIALNIHPTLLPKYRGPTTGAFILINNEKETGSTVHLISKDADTGNIVAQCKVALSPFDTLRSMQRKVYAKEPSLILEAITKLDKGFKPYAQNEELASIYPDLRKPEDSLIDPTKPLSVLINEIRASDPNEFPAYFYHHGEKVCIRLWRPDRTCYDDSESL